MVTYVAPIVALVGAVIYVVAGPQVKASELGRAAWWVGLFFTVWQFAAVHR
jgi:hypothetical protein